jgi:hypothetical protein
MTRRRFAKPITLMLAVVAALAVATPAAATQPEPQQFETIGQLTGPDSAAGTWTSTGLVGAAGTYTETFRFAGRTLHGKKVLVSDGGTIVLESRAVVAWLDACTGTFAAGSWHITDATGTYAGLKGGGTPAATGTSFGNVCTRATDVVHTGTAHDD